MRLIISIFMECPICFVRVHEFWQSYGNGFDCEDHTYYISRMACPECKNNLVRYKRRDSAPLPTRKVEEGFLIPIVEKPKKLDELIPKKYTDLYEESFHVAKYSTRASAALSRLCLQALLREYGKVESGNLFDEIQQVIDSGKLPSELEELMDVIRKNGNDAVHPSKNTNPGEIVEIDADEAEWGLDILEELFDHFIIKPKKQQDKLDKHKKSMKI